jgi:hypothetical protein
MAQSDGPYPVEFSVDYLDEPRDRLSVFLRVFMIIPIAILLAVISGQSGGVPSFGGAAGGTLLLGPLYDDCIPPEIPKVVVRLEPSPYEIHKSSDSLSVHDGGSISGNG